PKSFLKLEGVKQALDSNEIKFPLIVKPRYGSASFGLYICNSNDELNNAYRQCHAAIESSSFSKFNISEAVLIQEYIAGDEYGVDIVLDTRSRYLGHCAKKKLTMRAGETDKATVVEPQPFESAAKAIAAGLMYTGNL